MIKVLQVGATNVLGGIETYLHNYYKNIDSNQVKFDFVNMYDEICFQKEYESKGAKIYKLPNYRKHPFKYMKELKNILKEEQYDVLHFNMNSAIFLYPLISAKYARIPVRIAHAHNASSDKGFLKDFLHNLIRHFIPCFANYCFACSDYAGKWFFSNKIIQSDSFYIINNAIDVEKFLYDDKKRNKVRSELGVSNDDILIGHVGRFIKQKNHEFMIDILKEINTKNSNCKLILVGVGELQESIEKKVIENNLQDNVMFLGQRNDVNDLYQAFDIFILPSLYEGLPLVGIEAQVSGCKCFFSNRITRELKINDNSEYLDINNLKEWVTKILSFNSRLQQRNNSSYNEFDIKLNAEKLCAFYRKSLERNIKNGKE